MRALAGHALALATAFVVVACTVLPPHPPAPDDPTAYPPSSYGVDASGTPCEVACAHLAAVQCPEARPSKAGRSCPDICARGQALEELPTACLSRANTVTAVRACGVRCVQ
jgi:hypothetical protein